MLALEIATSKRGRLWATEYWKPLVDAVSRGGAKHDPRLTCPDLRSALGDLMETRDGRHWPKPGSPLSAEDDVALRLIILRRVKPGSESVQFAERPMPDTAPWQEITFPYFGTIGSSKYEAQTKRNRAKLAGKFTAPASLAWLGLAFQLSRQRMSAQGRDRDLDNLADALMPFFNRSVKRFEKILLLKLPPVIGEEEVLRCCCEPVDSV